MSVLNFRLLKNLSLNLLYYPDQFFDLKTLFDMIISSILHK
ncbi:hypothetical protein DYY66_2619 [Candidatus Nitrosotalea sp. FS]|nr:hypothetical protein [Candidatus Nitrosotalea sp. FS]